MRASVLFDGSCGLCVRFQRAVAFLDWLGLLEWIPSGSPAARRFGIRPGDLDRAMHLVHGPSVRAGFAAVKAILLRLPALYLAVGALTLLSPWLLLPVLVVFSPPFAPVGERVYARVARSRRCAV